MQTALITILILLIVFIPMILLSKWSNLYGKSEFDDIAVYNNKIYVFSNIYHSGGDGDSFRDCRISKIDWDKGIYTKRFATKEFSKLVVTGIINGKFWLKDESFCVFDPESFKIIFKQKEIGLKMDELKNVKIKDFYFNEIEKQVHFLAENGFKYNINPENFEITGKDFYQEESIIRKEQKVRNKTEFGIRKMKDAERFLISFQGKNISEEISFIKPDFLRSTSTNQIVEFDNPPCITIIHYDSLNSLAMFRISLISFTGEILWTINQENIDVKHNTDSENPAIIEHIYFKSPDLLLVFKAKRDKIVCINLEKGIVLWNLKL